jgi:hypothetical protein
MAAASTDQRGNAAAGASFCSSVETDRGPDEEDDSDPSPVTSSALTGSDPDQEVVQDKATDKSGQMAAARTNQRGKATGSCSSVKEDGGGHHEEDSKLSLVTGGALPKSCPDQEVVQEEATTPDEILSGWTHAKLEPAGCPLHVTKTELVIVVVAVVDQL